MQLPPNASEVPPGHLPTRHAMAAATRTRTSPLCSAALRIRLWVRGKGAGVRRRLLMLDRLEAARVELEAAVEMLSNPRGDHFDTEAIMSRAAVRGRIALLLLTGSAPDKIVGREIR
jgi:hypothetical protein